MRSTLLLLAGIATPLAAQSDTTAQRADTARLAPTVVTVLRTSLELSRAPFAVGVTTRDEIQRGKPGLALDEALAGIAGVQVDNRFNYALGERISIRGFGARAQFGVRGVRVLLDGIPMTLADGQTSLNNVDVANVARAEVVRGPASAIHGNASGGVIQLESNRASDVTLHALGVSTRTDYGAHGLRRYQGALGGRSGATSYTLDASQLLFDGYRQWNTAKNNHAGLLVTRETEARALSLTGNWVDYDARNPGGLSTVLLRANRDTVSPTNFNNKTGEQGRQGQLGGTWREQLGGMELQLSAHALQRHIDNPIPFTIVVIDRNAGGARLALSGAPRVAARTLRISAGTEMQLQHDDRLNFVGNGGQRGADTLDQLERVNNTAVFTQLALDVTPRLLALFGARYDRVNFRVTDRLIGAGNPDDSGERTMSAASPSLGLTWSVSHRLDLYTNYSTSFETPTTSELANQESGAGGMNPTLNPQHTRSFEIGVKERFHAAGIAGSYQLAAYHAHVRDALIPFDLPTTSRLYFRNAGSTKHRGIELATSLVLPWRLSLRSAYAYTDARFENYEVTRAGVTTVYDGKQVPGVAHNRGDATLSFQSDKLYFDWEARTSASIPVNDANSERSPSYVVHGLRAGLRDVRVGGVDVSPSVGVLNLFDRDYNTSVVVNANGGRYYEPGPPRSIYGGLSARF